MGLTKECLGLVSRQVVVTPQYGYGWVFGPQSPFKNYEEIEVLGPFRIRIKELFRNREGISGGAGLIEAPEIKIHGALLVFSPRHVGDWDFTSRVGSYNISLGSQLEEGPNGAVGASGFPAIQGFAGIHHAV